MPTGDDLDSLSPADLTQLVRELRATNEQLRSVGAQPPAAVQLLLDDQLRRTSLLTQLAIEFREMGDQAMIIEQTLRAIATHLALAASSIVLVGPGNSPELAFSAADGIVAPMEPEQARDLIERGLAGWVVRHGRSVALSDVARDRRWLEFSERQRSGSVIVIPIRQSGSPLGVLTVQRSLPHAFTSHDLILLEGVAAQLGVALSASRHQLGERRRRDQALALLAMSQFLSAEHSPAELAGMIQEKSAAVFGARYGLLFLSEGDSAPLHPVLPAGPAPDAELLHHCGGAARLAREGQRAVTTAPGPGLTCVAMPLVHHGVALGAYAQVHEGAGGFPANIWSLLTVFTHVVAAACATQRLVGRLTEQARLLEELVGERTRQLQRSRDVLRVVFDSLPDGILLLDASERLLAANTIFCREIAARHPRELVGQSYAAVWQALERRGGLKVELRPGGGHHGLTVRMSGPGGERRFHVERTGVAGEGGAAEQSLEFWREVRG